MESFMRRGWQWGRVVSVLFALLAMARARQQSEAESDLLPVYNGGPLDVNFFPVPTGRQGPPYPFWIAAPKPEGKYPVVQFQHGYELPVIEYTQLLHHVASYGFIAVAPELKILGPASKEDATAEIKAAAEVTNWLQIGLSGVLSRYKVAPDLDKFALVGHSRGGKVVFGLATHIGGASQKFSAIVGLDPVDGLSVYSLRHGWQVKQTEPHILKKESAHDLDLHIPTLIVGGGLSSQGTPPCAPLGISHDQFFNESGAPAFHFVSPYNGHMDYLDGECPKHSLYPTCLLCVNGDKREPMRKFSAGITVAFLEAYLNNNASLFVDAFTNYATNAPLTLNKPENYGSLPNFLAVQEA